MERYFFNCFCSSLTKKAKTLQPQRLLERWASQHRSFFFAEQHLWLYNVREIFISQAASYVPRHHRLFDQSYVLSPNTLFFLSHFYQTAIRTFSTGTAANTPSGAGFFARVGSFIVGAGFTALVSEIYIYKEVREGNLEMLKRQREIEKRIAALEKK